MLNEGSDSAGDLELLVFAQQSLDSAGLANCVIGGLAVAVATQARGRPTRDIDIFVINARAARRALVSAGFEAIAERKLRIHGWTVDLVEPGMRARFTQPIDHACRAALHRQKHLVIPAHQMGQPTEVELRCPSIPPLALLKFVSVWYRSMAITRRHDIDDLNALLAAGVARLTGRLVNLRNLGGWVPTARSRCQTMSCWSDESVAAGEPDDGIPRAGRTGQV